MSDQLVLELLKYSILLPILLAVGWFCLVQHRALRQVEEARVQDLKNLNERLITLSDKWTTTMSTIITTTNTQAEIMREIRGAITDLRDDVLGRR